MKYNIGDKVKVRTDLTVDEMYDGAYFTCQMKVYAGKEVTIKNLVTLTENIGGYNIINDSIEWTFTDAMLLPLKPLLDKSDILWMLAATNSRVNEHYEKHYCSYGREIRIPTMETLGRITFPILRDSKQMDKAIYMLFCDKTLYELEYKRDRFTFYETIWLAFKTWCFHTNVDTLDELTSGQWRAWAKEEGYNFDK